jgi:hypothetical protein
MIANQPGSGRWRGKQPGTPGFATIAVLAGSGAAIFVLGLRVTPNVSFAST